MNKRIPECHPNQAYCANGLCRSCYNKLYREVNRESLSKNAVSYHQANREHRLAYNKTWREENKKRVREYQKKRLRESIDYRLTTNLRVRIYSAFKNGYKTGSAVRDLGCSISQFKLFIENQFTEGMSWENYGEWHLDHVIPLRSFDLTKRQQFLEATNWLNYQPLWAKENLQKGSGV